MSLKKRYAIKPGRPKTAQDDEIIKDEDEWEYVKVEEDTWPEEMVEEDTWPDDGMPQSKASAVAAFWKAQAEAGMATSSKPPATSSKGPAKSRGSSQSTLPLQSKILLSALGIHWSNGNPLHL